MAAHLAKQFTGQAEYNFEPPTKVSRFGMNYDFRNKRLPVWQVTSKRSDKTMVFVDPATGQLVDQSTQVHRLERLSFSILYKWNILVPLTGRQVRDVLVVVVLSIALITTILGYMMLFRRRNKLPEV